MAGFEGFFNHFHKKSSDIIRIDIAFLTHAFDGSVDIMSRMQYHFTLCKITRAVSALAIKFLEVLS